MRPEARQLEHPLEQKKCRQDTVTKQECIANGRIKRNATLRHRPCALEFREMPATTHRDVSFAVAEQVVDGAAPGPLGGSDVLLRRPLPPVVLEGSRLGTSARATGPPPICASGPELPAASCPEGQFCAHALGCVESTQP